MTIEKKNVLVAGANGTTGKHIIELLKNHPHYNPVAMVRKQEQKEAFEKQHVKTILADLENDLGEAVKGAHKVIFAAGSKGKNVIGVDQEGAKKLMTAGKNEGITKYVMLSSMGADNPSQAEELKDYLLAKQNADQFLRNSGLNYTILRPGTLTDESGNGKIELEEKLHKRGKITRQDVAKTLVEVLDDNILLNQTVEILNGEELIIEAIH